MQEYLLEFSKYGIVLCMVGYTIRSLLSLSGKEGSPRKTSSFFQVLLIFLVQLFCFLDMYLITRDDRYLVLYLFTQVFLLLLMVLVRKIYPRADRLLLNNMSMLLGLGLCMLSALSYQKAIRQFVIALVSFAIALVIPFLIDKIRFFKKLTWIYASVGLLALSVVLIFGEITRGSKISFTIQGITFQPSEFVKILFLFFLAASLWEDISFRRVLLTTVLAAAHVLLLVLSTDLGSALIFFLGYLFVLFVLTKNYGYLFGGLGAGVAAATFAYFLFEHVRIRVMVWDNPWNYIDKQGYQITQSLFAITGGGWFGAGLMRGTPKSIPLVAADFMFSAVCEELGVIVGICVLLICLCSFVEMMLIAMQVHDRFYQAIVYGIGVMYASQIFLTVGGGMKMIPLTGVTLPLVSYGGSSVMTTVFMFFLVQGIAIRLKKEKRKG